MMNANEARDRVEAGILNDLMERIENAIERAVEDREYSVRMAISNDYARCVTLAMIELNKLGYITLYDFQENGTLTIIW